jgi:hypothetical protein
MKLVAEFQCKEKMWKIITNEIVLVLLDLILLKKQGICMQILVIENIV